MQMNSVVLLSCVLTHARCSRSLASPSAPGPLRFGHTQAFLKPAPKSEEEEKYLRDTLSDHPQFRLPPPNLAEAIAYFRKREVGEGDVLIEQARTRSVQSCDASLQRCCRLGVAVPPGCGAAGPPRLQAACIDFLFLLFPATCAQGQTGKYFFVVQSGTFALKLPAKPPVNKGEDGIPEQTVRALQLPCCLAPQAPH